MASCWPVATSDSDTSASITANVQKFEPFTCSAAHGVRRMLAYLARLAVIEIRISPLSPTWCSTLEICGRELDRIVVSTERLVARASSTASARSMTAQHDAGRAIPAAGAGPPRPRYANYVELGAFAALAGPRPARP